MQGVYAATDYWWTIEDKYPLAKMFNAEFEQEVRLQAGVGRRERLHAASPSGRAWSRRPARFYPPAVIKTYEKGETIPSLVGDVHYRPEDHQCVRPVIIVRGKMQKDMKNKEDYYDVVEIVPGRGR